MTETRKQMHRLLLLVTVCALLTLAAAVVAGAQPSHLAGPSFWGNGSKTLPRFRVRCASTLTWTNSGEIFQIFPKGLGGGNVNSSAHGRASVPAAAESPRAEPTAGRSGRERDHFVTIPPVPLHAPKQKSPRSG